MATSDPFIVRYREWLEIAQFEQKAIREQKWTELSRHMKRKEELMQELRAFESERPDWKKTQSEALKVLIHQVSDLEQLNHSLIAEKTKDMKTMVDDIQKRQVAGQQLRNRYITQPNRTGRKISGQG